MKKIIFQAPNELHEKLCKGKERTGASISEIIRRAIKAYLEKD